MDLLKILEGGQDGMETQTVTDYNRKGVAVVHNNMVEARYSMSLLQSKLFLGIITLINPDDTELKEYQISKNALLRMLNIQDSDDFYKTLHPVAADLATKALNAVDPKSKHFAIYPIFSKIEYKNSILTVAFNDRLTPFLLELKKEFTEIMLNRVKLFTSKYSVRIFQLLKQYQKIGERTIKVDELRDMLGLVKNKDLKIEKDSYKNFQEFKKRVLTPAQRDLKDTPFAFEYTTTKAIGSKKIESITFKLKKPQPQEQEPQPIQLVQEPQLNAQTKQKIIELLQNVLPENHTHKLETLLASCVDKYNLEYLTKQIEYTNGQKTKNYVAYLKKAIEEDYADAESSRIEKEKQREKYEQKMQGLEETHKKYIASQIEKAKTIIYGKYLQTLDNGEKQEGPADFINQKPIEDKIFTIEELFEQEAYKNRLNNAIKKINEYAQEAYDKTKENLDYKLENGLF